MTGEEYQAARIRLRLTHADFARKLGISTRKSTDLARADAVPAYIALAVQALLADPPPRPNYWPKHRPRTRARAS